MITIGTDSYITVDFADSYIQGFYGEDSNEYSIWDSLETSQKEMYLKKSAMQIDNLPFTGIKKYKDQVMQLPRCNDNVSKFEDNEWTYNDLIKYAQAENVVSLMNGKLSSGGEGGSVRRQLEGVTGFSLDGFSETYSGNIDSKLQIVGSQEALSMLSSWLHGGFEIL